jgi:hypothetical protein
VRRAVASCQCKAVACVPLAPCPHTDSLSSESLAQVRALHNPPLSECGRRACEASLRVIRTPRTPHALGPFFMRHTFSLESQCIHSSLELLESAFRSLALPPIARDEYSCGQLLTVVDS